MKEKKIYDALTEIDEKYIEEAENAPLRNNHLAWKKRTLVALVFAIIVIGGMTVVALRGNRLSETDYELNQRLILESAERIRESGILNEEDRVIGFIEELPIYRSELELIRLSPGLPGETEGPGDYSTAYRKVLLRKVEELILQEYGEIPTENEIRQVTEQQEEMMLHDTDDEMEAFHKEYLSTLGLTEDEYWAEFKPIETRRFLIMLRAQEVLRIKMEQGIHELKIGDSHIQFELDDNNDVEIDLSNIEVQIIDEEYRDLLI